MATQNSAKPDSSFISPRYDDLISLIDVWSFFARWKALLVLFSIVGCLLGFFKGWNNSSFKVEFETNISNSDPLVLSESSAINEGIIHAFSQFTLAHVFAESFFKNLSEVPKIDGDTNPLSYFTSYFSSSKSFPQDTQKSQQSQESLEFANYLSTQYKNLSSSELSKIDFRKNAFLIRVLNMPNSAYKLIIQTPDSGIAAKSIKAAALAFNDFSKHYNHLEYTRKKAISSYREKITSSDFALATEKYKSIQTDFEKEKLAQKILLYSFESKIDALEGKSLHKNNFKSLPILPLLDSGANHLENANLIDLYEQKNLIKRLATLQHAKVISKDDAKILFNELGLLQISKQEPEMKFSESIHYYRASLENLNRSFIESTKAVDPTLFALPQMEWNDEVLSFYLNKDSFEIQVTNQWRWAIAGLFLGFLLALSIAMIYSSIHSASIKFEWQKNGKSS